MKKYPVMQVYKLPYLREIPARRQVPHHVATRFRGLARRTDGQTRSEDHTLWQLEGND